MNVVPARGVAVAIAILPSVIGAPLLAAADPCDFADGSSAFTWDRVMTCYNSVPFNPADLSNAVAFLSEARERSDLRENFDARYGWRASLAALGTRSFSSDFAMQLAIVANHKEFYNPHWRYRRPWCYTAYLAAFMPFDFGSTVRTGKQIVFIEAAPFLPDLYQSFTGIDPRPYIGMRVVSINGVEPLQYFRDYGRDVYRFDTDDGENLNEVLQNAAYSIRISPTHDVPPNQAEDTYVLETKWGQRVTVTMPWIFAPRAAFGSFQDPLPGSSEEFAERCLAPGDTAILASSVAPSPASPGADGRIDRTAAEDDFVNEMREKRDMANRLRKKYGGNSSSGYFEVAPGLRWQTLDPVVPKADGAVAYAISDRATILRLDDFVQDWKDEVIAATNYACANTERLVLDMRNNSGGHVARLEWLTTHLFPDRVVPDRYSFTGRYLDSNVGRNELVDRTTTHAATYWGPGSCAWWYEAACYVDPSNGQVLTDWSQDKSVELRGGRPESLKQRAAFRNQDLQYLPGLDPIACPGKFQGRTLVVLSNGTGGSAGYFFPEGIRDQATIVTAGGRLGEPLVTGIARGGAVWAMNNRPGEAWIEQFLSLFYGPATDPLPFIVRDVESFMEQPGLYKADLTTLHMDGLSFGDTHVDVWGDSRDTDGYVYRKVLSAVQALPPAP